MKCHALPFLFAVFLAWTGTGTAEPLPVDLTMTPIPLNRENPDFDRVGWLVYRGGVEIMGTASGFGGLSGLVVSDDGSHLLAVSDRGHWLGARLVREDGRLTGLDGAWTAPIPDLKGDPLSDQSRSRADAEALTKFPRHGLAVGFEGTHRVRAYAATVKDAYSAPRAEVIALPPDFERAVARLPRNKGIESLGVLPDGRLIAIAEGGRGPNPGSRSNTVTGWILEGRTAQTFAYPIQDRFLPTDLTVLANGAVLVLERRFNFFQGIATRIRLIAADTFGTDFRAGDTVEGMVLATFAYPFNTDNMEGISAYVNEAGETLIYIVSDDNFLPIQRTLLMSFQIAAGVFKCAGRAQGCATTP